MSNTQNTAEGAAVMATKAAPPAAVSIASLAGYPVSDLVLWATFIYTVLMIGHKIFQIWRDVKGKGHEQG
jgi:hypothetical protein